MSKLFPHLFTPGKIGSLTLKNRIMKAPQSSGMSNMDGTVSERLVRYYRQQAAGGAGMIIVEYAYVDDIGAKSAHCHLGISNNEHIPGLAWLAENIREQGAVPAIQIEHCGRQKFLGTQPICAPSAIPWPKLWDQYGVQAVPHVLTIEEIQDIVHAFGDAALRAKQAGFELVEIHGAHGYLLTNFFSPTTNHRTDLYGGSLENRMRIYVEIVRDVRKKVGPDFPVTIRLSGTDYEPDGFPIEDTIELAKVLEKEGIDAFHISGGDHHTMIHQVSPMAIDVCHNVWAAEAIKKVVHVPVIASGSITLPEYAEEIIASGKGDFVGLGRPLWADPEWPLKAMEDRPEDIRPCIRCNEGCLERTFFNFKAITCAVNPTISREGELDLKPAAKPRKIAVVGGGPAGMEAARVCKLRGHEVTLFEEKELGGLLHEASVPEFKSDIRPLCKYLITQIEKLGIPVEHKKATAADLAGYDAVICATGGSAVHPKAFSGENVCTVTDILTGNVKVKDKQVAVIGSGMTGLETSELLVSQGNHVTIVEMAPRIAPGAYFQHVDDAMPKLQAAHTVFMVGQKLLAVHQDSIELENVDTGSKTMVPCDQVVLSLGVRPENGLYESIKSSFSRVYNIGDSNKIGRIHNATEAAYQLAMSL